MKKLFIILVAIFTLCMPGLAYEKIKEVANITQEFTLNEIPNEVEFTSNKEMVFNDIIIPENSKVVMEVLAVQKEKRWHKSGYILLKVKHYETESGEITDLSKEEIYLVARKYEKIDGKEAAKTGAEIVVASAASFVVPGIDIAYYFTKGAIQREKNPNWFKAGVSNAYDNSIFWFWLKGKPIELEENEQVSLKEIDEDKAYKILEKIKEKETK